MRTLFFLFCLLPIVSQAEISVVTSIRPLYQITSAIMRGVDKPELLIGNEASAHHFAFKPSHFKVLQRADLVIWIDRHFESGFQRLPEILNDQSQQLELLPKLGLKNADGHIWYSPQLLIEISEVIARKLSELDADNLEIYQNNLREFQQQVSLWEQAVNLVIKENSPRYLLDHDFLQHFEAAFELRPIAVIHDSHDQPVGIRALQAIEHKLQVHSVNCLISNESDFSRIGTNLADQYSLSRHVINPFADNGDAATRFIRHLQHLTEILASC